MAETLAYNFVGNDELSGLLERIDKLTSALSRNFDDLGDEARQMGRKLGATERDAKQLGEELEDTGDKAREMGRKFVSTAAEIEITKAAIRGLTREFERTGDFDLFKRLGNERGRLAALERIGKDLEETVGRSAFAGLASGFRALPPEAQGAIALGVAGAIVIGMPAIGAAIGAAVTLGVGGGALAAGIALAAKDPRVPAAFRYMADGIMDQLADAATVFVEPLIQASYRFGDAFSQIMPSIRNDFASLLPYVEQLADGAAGFVSAIMPGVDSLVGAAGPMLGVLAEELPKLGDAIGDFFSEIAAGGPGATQFLRDFFTWTEYSVRALGLLIGSLEKAYAAIRGIAAIMTGDLQGGILLWDQFGDHSKKSFQPLDKGADDLHKVSQAAKDAGLGAKLSADDFQGLSSKINQTAMTADVLAGQMTDKVMNAMLDGDRSVLGFEEAMTRMTEGVKSNGTALDIHTEKGQANRQAILGMVQANLAQYDSNIRSGMGAEQATEAYQANTSALEHQMRQAGFTQQQIDGLIGKYRDVPHNVDTDIAMHGLEYALNGLEDAIRLANHLDGRVARLTVEEIHRTVYTGDSGPPSSYFRGLASGGRIGSAANGGPRSMGPYRVGENGPEEIWMSGPGTVIPNNRFTGSAPAGGGADGRLVVDMAGVSSATGLDAVLANWFMKALRDKKIQIRTADLITSN